MNKTFIIAEAGVNHNGSLDLAKKLVDVAANAYCDCVKFQTFKAENLLLKTAEKAPYQKKTTEKEETQYEMIKKLELSEQMHIELIEYCKQKNIMFLSTPFDNESVDLLNKLGIEIFKIPSGEITNLPLLRKINTLNKEVILSTGNSTIEEIKDALQILKACKVSLLHCNSEYPTPFEDVNLKAMQTLKRTFDLDVGYSDHTIGIEVPIAAVALGATIIEKHFTLDKNMEGPDHKASLNPFELKDMVISIRNIEKAIGTGEKIPTNSEMKNQLVARKSIIASKIIKEGEMFTEDNLTTKRPATGICPMKWYDVIGKIAKRNYEKDDFIEL